MLVGRQFAFETTLKLLLERRGLLVGHGHCMPESHPLFKKLLHVGPVVYAARAAHGAAIVGKTVFGNPLPVDITQMQVIAYRIVAQPHAAGLMVGSDENKGLVGMCEIEVIGMAQSLVEVNHLLDDSAAVVGMAAIVDITTFNHHEEAVTAVAFQVLESRKRHVGEIHGPFHRVDGKIDLALGYLFGIEQQHTARLLVLELVKPAGDVDTVGTECVYEIIGITILVLGATQFGAGNEVIARRGGLETYLVIHGARRHMGVKRSGSRIVRRHGCYECHSVASVKELLGHRCYGR